MVVVHPPPITPSHPHPSLPPSGGLEVKKFYPLPFGHRPWSRGCLASYVLLCERATASNAEGVSCVEECLRHHSRRRGLLQCVARRDVLKYFFACALRARLELSIANVVVVVVVVVAVVVAVDAESLA